MQEEEIKPATQPSGAMPPPRPPIRTAIGISPAGDDDESFRRQRKHEIVRIPLRPKLSAIPTIKLPTLLPGGPTGIPGIVLPKKPIIGELTTGQAARPSARADKFVSAALVFLLQAVLLFEAYTSIDQTVAVLFLIVAVALSIPGYGWAFGGKLRRTPLKIQTQKRVAF
jgi:hypothetical protein